MRDLLVCVDQGSGMEPRLDAALGLAERLGAHVTVLCLIAEPFLRGGLAHHAPDEIIREHLAHAEAEMQGVLAGVREEAERRGIALETRTETGNVDRLPFLLARHARHADLTVVGRPDPERGGADEALLAEAAFMDSGRPALIVPGTGNAVLPPRRALIAWDGSREAARATGDALPLLAHAESVAVLVIDGRDVSGHPGERPGAELADHLARHGRRAEIREDTSGRRGGSETIRAEAAAAGADLVVMGGYGHSRLREMMLGGATRHILHHATLPVLMAH